MTIDLASHYRKYVDYVTRLHRDLDNTVGKRIPPEHRAQLLSYEDFCCMWHRWGKTEGLQEIWSRKFDLGYDQVVSDLFKQIDAAVRGKNHVAVAFAAHEAA
jgi:hypothetical protein